MRRILLAALCLIVLVGLVIIIQQSDLNLANSGPAIDQTDKTKSANAQRSLFAGIVGGPINEASGLVEGRSGRIWVVNDSGDKNQIYGLNKKGQLRQTVQVQGALNIDWEDLARRGSHLYIADIGDNGANRDGISAPYPRVYRLPEPGRQESSVPSTFIELEYPDGPRDAEALIIDPLSGDIYIITKRESRSRLYRLRNPRFNGQRQRLSYIGQLGYGGVVAADICPNGQKILVKRYGSLDLYQGSSITSALKAGRPQPRLLVPEPQGESIAAKHNCSGYYTLSEGNNQPLINYLDR